MVSEKTVVIYYASGFLIWVFLPFWLIVAGQCRWAAKFAVQRPLGGSVLLCALLMWPLMVLHRTLIEVPLIQSRNPPDSDWDGVGGNAMVLVMGWLFSLIFQIPHIAFRLILAAARRRRKVNGLL
jgi:hypothetical protein